jgi:FkbM family methyltransferase
MMRRPTAGIAMAVHIAKRLVRRLLGAAAPVAEPVAGLVLWNSGIRTLKRAGFAPKTVFDIGVAQGTPHLYEAFPDARYVLVEPVRECRAHMKGLARRLDAEIFPVALGDRDGESEIEVRRDDIQGATFYREIGPLGPTERYVVPVRRFDSLFADFPRPALCKIDVQGAELTVLHGMGARIHDLDAIIVESSTIATVADAPELFDVVAFLRRQGFVIFDLLGLTRRPLDRALAQLDLLVVKEDSAFRTDRRWRASL